MRTRVTESHFSRCVRFSFGFRGRFSHFPHQTARPSLNVKPHGAETAHLIAVAVVEEEVHPGVHGCNDRPDGTAAANILSAKDWAWCLGCRALNSSWGCQTVWSSRAPSSMSCQRAGKTCAAIDNCANIVDLDAQNAADGYAVMHDATLNRTTNGTGYVKYRTLSYIKSLYLELPVDRDGNEGCEGAWTIAYESAAVAASVPEVEGCLGALRI